MDYPDYAGTVVSCVGVVFLLVALAGSQTGLLPGDTVTSLLINAIGGALASVGAGLDRVWAFVVLNGIWAILSSFNLTRVMAKTSRRPGMQHEGQKVVQSGCRDLAPALVFPAPSAAPMHWEGCFHPGAGTAPYFVATRV